MENFILFVSIACTLLGACIGYFTFQRNKDKQTKEETSKTTTVEVKLDYISKGIDEIRLDNRSNAREIQALKENFIRLEQSNKSAHHRIDGIENKIIEK